MGNSYTNSRSRLEEGDGGVGYGANLDSIYSDCSIDHKYNRYAEVKGSKYSDV